MEHAVLASPGNPNEGAVTTRAGFDRTAFAALVARYQPDLLRVSYVILGDTSLAEDAAQAAWIQAWRKHHQLRDQDKVRSWLVAVAANEARQIARKRLRASVRAASDGFATEADPRLADLAAALAKLTPDDRRLIGLRYVAGLTSEEVGEAVGLSGGAVRHRLMRLLARLREDLSE